ncbi:hypothetical protein LCGC14_0390850 [marine sediment metagenome]|uniref:Uncharacterized protein n=1 Tax=marine sediment metagenome TaxID=412755 RepID=A0A0F9SZW7_9ZZZZ
MVRRYKKCTNWLEPVINQRKVDLDYPKYKGVVMFPSTHDITEKNISECLCVINKLLEAGNQVLIVSKPQLKCISLICESIKTNHPDKFKSKVTFRFTIGSTSGMILKFWEPGAPDFLERWESLKYAYHAGFNTSVSCEPYLDQWPNYVYEATEEYVTDKIWVGMLRDFNNRVVLDGVTPRQEARYVKPLKALQNPMIVKAMYQTMKELPKIIWKDSIRNIITKGVIK